MRPHKGTYSRVVFLEPGGAPGIVAHCNALNDALNLDVNTFVNDVTAEAREWLNEVSGTEPFETNLAQSMRRHPNGMAPYIEGVSVIG